MRGVTTSYENGMPSESSQGYQAWNPSVGLYYEGGKRKRESFGGVVSALQDTLARGNYTVRAYPENFAGIIAAIQDLKLGERQPGSDTGPIPPGDVVDNTDPDNPVYIPGPHEEGELWFDLRQGRLFVYSEAQWWQANGADGLPLLLPDEPAAEQVPGQLWFNTLEQTLYIFTGTWIDTNGTVYSVEDKQDDHEPVWAAISGVGGTTQQTSATLPFIASVNPSSTQVVPSLDTSAISNQNDYNEWLYSALEALDASNVELASSVVANSAAPTSPSIGQLWYDTNTLTLNIWNDDGVTQQWTPTDSHESLSDSIASLTTAFESNRNQHNIELINLTTRVDQLDRTDDNKIQELNQKFDALDFKVDQLPEHDLTPYALSADVVSNQNTTTGRLDTLEGIAATLSDYQTKADAQSQLTLLTNALSAKATPSDVNAAIAQIPDVTAFVTQADVDTSVAAITNNFLPRSGGEVNGHFILNKQDISQPTFDASASWWNSQDLFKVKSYSPQNLTATFGATNDKWQYAWKFAGHEEFAWIHNGNKVFSLAEDGPACHDLYLSNFQANTDSGRTLGNKISVRDKFTAQDTEIANMKSDIATLNTVHGTDSKNIYYGDTQPVGTISDGDIWFDSKNLRLNIQHSGFWVFPDRVEDTALKSALFNAVSTSTDYETLKIKLLAVLC